MRPNQVKAAESRWFREKGGRMLEPLGTRDRSARDLAEYTARAAIAHLFETVGADKARAIIMETAIEAGRTAHEAN